MLWSSVSDFATLFLLVYQVAAAQEQAHSLLYFLAWRKKEGKNTCQEKIQVYGGMFLGRHSISAFTMQAC